MRITLSFPECGTWIPYFDETCDAATRHEYVDLRANPEAIDELPELEHAPEWKQLLLTINGAESIFRTFGCDRNLVPGTTTETGDPNNPDGLVTTEKTFDAIWSYMHLGFADIARCTSQDDYFRLCGRLGRFLAGCSDFVEKDGFDYYNVELGIETLSIDDVSKGTVLSVSCDVLGDSEEDVKAKWGHLMATIAEFLAAEKLI